MGTTTLDQKLARIAEPPAVVGLSLALVALPVLAVVDPVTEAPAPVGALLKWGVALSVVAVAVGWEGRSFAAVGIRRPTLRRLAVDVVIGLLAGVLAVAVFVVTTPVVEALGFHQEPGASEIAGPSLLAGVVGALTAGVTEELLFRGYPIERLLRADFSPVVAGTATWGAFVIAHVPTYPPGALVQIALVALLFTALYLWRRSLVPVVLAHVLNDLLGVLQVYYGW